MDELPLKLNQFFLSIETQLSVLAFCVLKPSKVFESIENFSFP